MEFVITQGQVTVGPIPPAVPDAPEGAVAGYILNVQDAATGIIVRISMGHGHAAKLGAALKQHTDEHPEFVVPQIETFAEVPPLRPVE